MKGRTRLGHALKRALPLSRVVALHVGGEWWWLAIVSVADNDHGDCANCFGCDCQCNRCFRPSTHIDRERARTVGAGVGGDGHGRQHLPGQRLKR